jgi:hypothetical protein
VVPIYKGCDRSAGAYYRPISVTSVVCKQLEHVLAGYLLQVRDKNDFFLIYYTDSIYKVYRDKLQNCSCNQFHYIGTYKQVETNSMTNNRGGNNGSEN